MSRFTAEALRKFNFGVSDPVLPNDQPVLAAAGANMAEVGGALLRSKR
jgi:hypothetical protein